MRARALIPRAKTASPKAEAAKAPAPARPEVRQILHTPRPQAKLTVGAPDDAFEKEADQVADQVMRMPEEPGRRPTVSGGSDLVSRIQRAVRFNADFSNVSLTPTSNASISGDDYEHDYASFSADADITAVGDTEAEIDQWDVGILQDMVVNWEREYWQRDNADGRGRFVEQVFRPINTAFRDQMDGAVTVWSADDEHQDLSSVAKTPVGARFQASATITTADEPSGGDTIDGSGVTGMDASDGTGNIDIERTGTRFDTFISAHNTVTDEWRHLRRLNWNYQKSLDFTGSGGTLSVGPERPLVGHHGPYAAGRSAPLTSGTTANDAVADDANWRRRRVNGWT